MNCKEFTERFPQDTLIGQDITEDEACYYHDNGKDVGVWRIDRRTTCGSGEMLSTENSHIARHYYRQKKEAQSLSQKGF